MNSAVNDILGKRAHSHCDVVCHINSKPFLLSLSSVRSAKHGRSVVVTLQSKDSKENSLPFHLATETTEELYEWYKVAWDITQREGTREFEVKIIMHIEKEKKKPLNHKMI